MADDPLPYATPEPKRGAHRAAELLWLAAASVVSGLAEFVLYQWYALPYRPPYSYQPLLGQSERRFLVALMAAVALAWVAFAARAAWRWSRGRT